MLQAGSGWGFLSGGVTRRKGERSIRHWPDKVNHFWHCETIHGNREYAPSRFHLFIDAMRLLRQGRDDGHLKCLLLQELADRVKLKQAPQISGRFRDDSIPSPVTCGIDSQESQTWLACPSSDVVVTCVAGSIQIGKSALQFLMGKFHVLSFPEVAERKEGELFSNRLRRQWLNSMWLNWSAESFQCHRGEHETSNVRREWLANQFP